MSDEAQIDMSDEAQLDMSDQAQFEISQQLKAKLQERIEARENSGEDSFFKFLSSQFDEMALDGKMEFDVFYEWKCRMGTYETAEEAKAIWDGVVLASKWRASKAGSGATLQQFKEINRQMDELA